MSHISKVFLRWVFEPYTWDPFQKPFSTYNGSLIPSRIPLSALIDGEAPHPPLSAFCTEAFAGPIAGGPFPLEHPNPRAVSVEFFNQVCPEDKRTRISIKEMNEGLGGRSPLKILQKYSTKLLGMSDGCVELYGFMEHPFDWM